MSATTTSCINCGHRMCDNCHYFDAGYIEPQKKPSRALGSSSVRKQAITEEKRQEPDTSERDSMSADHLYSTRRDSTSENDGIPYDIAMLLLTHEKHRSALLDLLARFYDDEETLKLNLCLILLTYAIELESEFPNVLEIRSITSRIRQKPEEIALLLILTLTTTTASWSEKIVELRKKDIQSRSVISLPGTWPIATEDEGSGVDDISPRNAPKLRQLLVKSEGFQLMVSDLYNMAHTLNPLRSNELFDLARENRPLCDDLETLCASLECADVESISLYLRGNLDPSNLLPFQRHSYFKFGQWRDRPSLFDRVKIYLEDITDSSWDWWPFAPPLRLHRRGFVGIRWKCVSIYTELL